MILNEEKLNLIKAYPKYIRQLIIPWKKVSCSQDGEDMILRNFFLGKSEGFYIDVGAHHPIRFSNTYYFYRKGWRGVNIEPNPQNYALFKLMRSKDININAGIAEKNTRKYYYQLNDSALNTFSESLAKQRAKNERYSIINKTMIDLVTLESVLARAVPQNKNIDFLNIDVEGFDYQVLKSNNWSLHKPTYILVEDSNLEISNLNKSHIYNFLSKKGYKIIAITSYTSIYKLKR